MDRRRVRLHIHGGVQGVAFRASARAEAQRLGLTGWVRNRLDGSVESVAEGEPGALEAFARWCQHGPPAAQVSQVERHEEPASGEFATFEVERTR